MGASKFAGEWTPREIDLAMAQSTSEIVLLGGLEALRGTETVSGREAIYVRYRPSAEGESLTGAAARVLPVSRVLAQIPEDSKTVEDKLKHHEVRLRQYARELLGIESVKTASAVEIGLVDAAGAGYTGTGPARRFATRVATWALGAPSTQLLEMSAFVADQDQRVVRLPPHVMGLLSIEEGDFVVLEWFNRRVRTRAYSFPADFSLWVEGEKGFGPTKNLRHCISVPISVRRQLRMSSGSPKAQTGDAGTSDNERGVLAVRRSVGGVLRKHLYKHLALFAGVFVVLNPGFVERYFSAADVERFSWQGTLWALAITLFAVWLTERVPNNPHSRNVSGT